MFKSSFRVHWVDTDTAGVMHFSNFFRYFEACEEEFYQSIGMPLAMIRDKFGVMLPRVEAQCEYKIACRFDDEIIVAMKVRDVAEKTITYDFQVTRKGDQKPAAVGHVKCIAINSQWKATSLPPEVTKVVRENLD